MKKYSIFLMAALALGFTACDNYEEPNPAPQTNPQETIMTADGVTVAPGETLAGGAVNLQELKDNAADAAVLELVKLENFPSKAAAKVVMEISDTDDFATVQEVATTVTDSVAYVTPADWQAAHLALYGKNPMQRTSYVRYALYSEQGTSLVRLGYDAENKCGVYYGASSVQVTPYDAEVWIEEAYYVVVNGDKSAAIQLTGSGDRFDNPKFSGMFTATDGATWQILPQSAINGGSEVYGPEVEDEKSGNLVEGTSGVIAEAGDYVVTVNMEAKTYQVAAAIQEFFVALNGGSLVRSNIKMVTNDYVTYTGYIVPKDGTFRVYTAAKSSSNSYGMVEGSEVVVDGYNYAVDLEYPSKTNITLGLPNAIMPMWAVVDVNALTFNAYVIETIGIIGDATEGGWDADTDMTPNSSYTQWTASNVVLSDGTIKFRANDAWDTNWGGTADNLVTNGDNIAVSAGTYDITLDFSAIPYTCSLTAK